VKHTTDEISMMKSNILKELNLSLDKGKNYICKSYLEKLAIKSLLKDDIITQVSLDKWELV